MDKELIKERFAGAISTYDRAAVAQRHIAERLAGLMEPYASEGGTVFEAGCGTGIMSRLIMEHLHPDKLYMVDLSESYSDSLADLDPRRTVFLAGDAEEMPLPQGLSAVVSSSALQWFERPERFLERSADALAEGGILAVATYGVENMREVGALSGVSLHYPSCDRLRRMIPPSLELEHFSEQIITLTFGSAREVLRHLRQTGVSGIERPPSAAATRRLIADYDARYSDGKGSVTLTYHPIYIVARRRASRRAEEGKPISIRRKGLQIPSG